MKSLLSLSLLALASQVASAATITFLGRTDVASGASYNLTDMGTTDWAYWDTSDNPASNGSATNDMNGGFGIGSISNFGTGSELRGTNGAAIDTNFSYDNGSSSAVGTENGVTGLFSKTLATVDEGVQLGITLADAGVEYTISIWTGGFSTQKASIVGSLSGASDYVSGETGGTGSATGQNGWYGDNVAPREAYLYTFNVTADNANDVFNFSIATAGTQAANSHVLIGAAAVAAAIPEPGSFAFLAGLCMVGFVFLRRR